MPDQSPKRGAIPTPRSALAAAVPYSAPVGAPPNFIVIPKQISMWGNDVHGNCVTAEEAFAKACNNPEIFISDDQVISWATKHDVLEGAYLPQVMTWMQDDGFPDGPLTYDDGSHYSVDWTNAGTLQSAIFQGPVKIGVAAAQVETAWEGTRQVVDPGGSQRDFTTTPTRITASRCAAMVPYPGWHNSLESRCPQESTGRRAMRCSRGIPSGSSTCPP